MSILPSKADIEPWPWNVQVPKADMGPRENSHHKTGNAFANGRLSCDIDMNIPENGLAGWRVGFGGWKVLVSTF